MISNLKVSRNLTNLYRLLKEQLNWEADLDTFRRTYASRPLLMGGAFSWTMKVKDENGRTCLIGSCYPLKDYSRRDTVIELSLSWGDIEIFPYTPEEYKKVLELRKAKEHDC